MKACLTPEAYTASRYNLELLAGGSCVHPTAAHLQCTSVDIGKLSYIKRRQPRDHHLRLREPSPAETARSMAEERSRTIVTNILPQNPMSPSPPPSSTGADHRDGGNGVVDDLRTTSIFSSLSNLFLSERFSDMSIRCRGREFKAHCAIVCAQSPFFDRAITSGFQVRFTRR